MKNHCEEQQQYTLMPQEIQNPSLKLMPAIQNLEKNVSFYDMKCSFAYYKDGWV